ncbi:MAG: DUF4450 domain-containing protein [Candidatus Didemnitutus sp.]|nr:DUF4450 domain-containing protein [Candidatus Didemnitutus sp.]
MVTRPTAAALAAVLLVAPAALAQTAPAERAGTELRPNLAGQIARPLRYRPEGGDFVIVNGLERFNRPLYGGASAFRVDAGDRPEFSLYLPGRGGVLRLALLTGSSAKWLSAAAQITARYRAGTMVYVIRDTALGDGTLELTALAPRSAEGLLLRAELHGNAAVELAAVFGGVTGERGRRDGDLGTEAKPVRDYFAFQADACRGNSVTLGENAFIVRAPKGQVAALLPTGTRVHVADATFDPDLGLLLTPAPAGTLPEKPVAVARVPLTTGRATFLALQNLRVEQTATEVLDTYREVAAERTLPPGATHAASWTRDDLPALFAREESALRAVAGRVSVDTPDAFLNAAVPALNLAADAVWDDRQNAFLHGAVAWRVRLLGWRVAYAGDALGWHERTRVHFDGYAAQQNTSPIPAALPAPEAAALLARHEAALHSNGDLTNSHYDMNLVALDTIFRHLRWTGDLAYARKIWPTIERSLAWERRLFRREFGSDKSPLYEAYAAIWASDDLAYSGGGATHATAANLFHHREAARLARLLGLDAAPYDDEAAAIERGLNQHLWLPREGWFAESRDLLGLQRPHPSAAAWTVYHALDAQATTPLQAWQLARYVDTALPQFPLDGPGVPPGANTIATTNWMPYTWSLNNVVFAETTHTALALWQAGWPDAANALFKGAVLDSMFLGLCPGNVGLTTALDAYRRESQRDFGDAIGIASRAIVEGLFGVTPDLLRREVVLRPGFPVEWDHATLHHPDFDFAFVNVGAVARYRFTPRFAVPVSVRLRVPARGSEARVTVNGQPAAWTALPESVGRPCLEIVAAPAPEQQISIEWRGDLPPAPPAERDAALGEEVNIDVGARIAELADPQRVLAQPRIVGATLRGQVAGLPGARTLFARVEQGPLRWWQPIELRVSEAATAAPLVFTTDWRAAIAPAQCEPLALAPLFNDRVTELFRHDYLAPRSPFASLALARNGYGTWTHPNATFPIDDSGLRRAATNGALSLPNGVPLATPAAVDAPNVAFVSQWENFPRELTTPLAGRARKIYLLMAGSTWAMQSRLDNGEIVVTYRDGTVTRLALENPTTWWPIDQDYFVDDFAFARSGGLPLRVDLKTGLVRVLDATTFNGAGRTIPGGAATVLDLALDPTKELQSLTVRALANDVVIGLMSATLERP